MAFLDTDERSPTKDLTVAEMAVIVDATKGDA